MRAKDLLQFAKKAKDPERAALEEAARMAKFERHNVWEGTEPPKPTRLSRVLALLPGS